MAEEEDFRFLCKIVDSLSGEQRRCIVAFYYNQMSLEEIAGAYRMQEKEVARQLESAKQQICRLQQGQEKSFSLGALAAQLFLAFGEEALTVAACGLTAGIPERE
ncbi:MAG: hypothetical protein Q4C58_07410 [Eubacteriales bacterium]|nr:hypothetical protein [Eubacteriales bacterium]